MDGDLLTLLERRERGEEDEVLGELGSSEMAFRLPSYTDVGRKNRSGSANYSVYLKKDHFLHVYVH